MISSQCPASSRSARHISQRLTRSRESSPQNNVAFRPAISRSPFDSGDGVAQMSRCQMRTARGLDYLVYSLVGQ